MSGPPRSEARYEGLRADRILSTLEKLQERIAERFPDSGLSRVCAQVIDTGRWSSQDAARVAQPNWLWRGALALLLTAGVAAQIYAARLIHLDGFGASAPDLVQGLEAAVNLLILFGGAIWFLLSLEERFKRRRVLDGLHRLRSLAHVVDMHQLTKDPTILLSPHPRTKASPQRAMTRFELSRYLDYSAEMLALIGKLAALYGDRMRDAVVIDAVNDVENLTSGLGRKIWQKITIISALEEPGA
jgi:hypothetical protein